MFVFNPALCGNHRYLFLNIHEVDSNICQPRSNVTFVRFRRPWSLPSFLADRAEKAPSLPRTSQFQLDLRSADRAILLRNEALNRGGTWVKFDNTALGYAYQNALALMGSFP
jgi:hypothetical protein